MTVEHPSGGIVVAHQPAYLPWPGYVTRLFDPRVEQLILLDHVQFSERGWQNRNIVADRRGNPTRLTVPVHRRHGQAIQSVTVAGADWARRHWRTLVQHYGNARYWPQWSDRLHAVYHARWDMLVELNVALLHLLLDGLDTRVSLVRSSTLGLTQAKTRMLVELCERTGAQRLRVGTGAVDYLDAAMLRGAGIRVEVTTYQPPPALAARGPLSTLDTLLHHGPNARELIAAGTGLSAWDRTEAVPA